MMKKSFLPKIDPHYFNAESNLIESFLNRDILIDSSPKFDYLLEEFSGELAHIDPIPPGIEKADFDLEEEIHLVENLFSGQKDLVFVKSSADDTKVSIPGVERLWLSRAEGFILPNHDTGRILPAESQRNTTDSLVVVTDSSATEYNSADESLVCSTPLPLLKKLDGVEPTSGSKTIKSILRIISLEREINPRNPQHAFKRCEACGSSTHTTTDHYDIEWFKRGEALQAKKCDIRKPIWYLDSGCSRHMTRVKSYLHKYEEQPGPKFDEKRGIIFNSNKEIVMIATRVRDVYVLDMTSYAQESCFFAKASKNLNWIWHKRLAHLNFKTINKLAKQNLVIGLHSLVYSKDKPCSSCEKGKHHRASFKTKQTSSIKKYLHLLHMDLFGPVTPRHSESSILEDNKLKKPIISHLMKALIKFSKPSVDNINIAENERYPADEYLHPYEPSQRYQTNSNDVSFIEPYESPKPVVLETKVSSDQNGQTDNMSEHSNHNNDEQIIDNLLNTEDIQISKQLSFPNVEDTSVQDTISIPNPPLPIPSVVTPAPQDRWSQDKHIDLFNIIRNPRAVMLTRAMAKQLTRGYNQQECIDYDETFAPVARHEAIRIFLAFATYMNFIVYQIDVKSAFLNGKLKEEVYVKQPLGFESNELPSHVCKLDKALYELKQAPRAWYLKGTPSLGLWYPKCSGFDLKGYLDSDYVGCNMDRKSTSGPDLNGKFVNETQYRGMIGSLMYLTARRPDIQFSTCLCTRYQANPKESYLIAVKRIFRDHILKGDMELHLIPTQYQLADIFTKPLDEPTFKRLIVKLGGVRGDIGYHGEIRAKGTHKKSCFPPRWRLLMGSIIQCLEYDNKESPFTTHMKAICKLDVPVVSKASNPFLQTEEVPQDKKPRAKKTKSSSAKYKSLSHPSPPTPVVGEMHKEAQQAAGGPTSLGATHKEGAHPQLSSGSLSVLVDKTKFVGDGLKTAHTDSGTNEESIANDISKKIKLKDLSEFLKDTRSAFFTPDSPQDDPIIVTDESEEKEADKEDTHDTSHDMPEDTSVPPPPSPKLAQIQESMAQARPSYPDVNHLTTLLVTYLKPELSKLLASHNFASCLPIELKELPLKFTKLFGEIKELKQDVKDMEIELPGDLKEIPTKLETFTSTISSLTPKFATVVENASEATTKDVPSLGQATASPTEGEKNTKDAETNQKDELVNLLGTNVVTQEDGSEKVISNLMVSDLHLAEWREVIQACPDKSEKGWKTI
ncbi:retrovirus-related pol polyprotein from transposon TNT 1-94 [Tanacetum coccineum]|uniref:Retrovirus-related pol polyprotein from transposon TNT 1-94 n=1 Tax=Tanacetum coccineum TaxID=301880 RepID=A0ABQ5IX47_9ASTR